MRKIPLLAGKCPYCLDKDQTVYGRLFILLFIIVALIGFSYYYVAESNKTNSEIEKLIETM